MALRDKIIKLTEIKDPVCVTISLNTHRTHPDNKQDVILLKKLLNEAAKRIEDEFNKRETTCICERINSMADKINENCNLDSLHIFISDTTEEIIRIPWPTYENKIQIAKTFDIRPLIKAYNRSEDYLLLFLSQNGAQLFEAVNNAVIEEILNDDFPFDPNPYYIDNAKERSNAKAVDDMVREYYNNIDKAVVRAHRETELDCIVMCTEDNYSYLMQIADEPHIYLGNVPINYHDTKPHQLAEKGWEIVKQLQHQRRLEAIKEMREAVGGDKVVTQVEEIYQAAIDGRGDMLIVNENYMQPAKIIDERNIKLVSDTDPEAIEDITSDIAWNILSKKGRVYFTQPDEVSELGEIILKTRY